MNYWMPIVIKILSLSQFCIFFGSFQSHLLEGFSVTSDIIECRSKDCESLVEKFTHSSLIETVPCISISPEPIAVAYTTDSILTNLPLEFMDYVGDKSYFGTRTSIIWCADDTHIVATCYLDHSLQVYQFDKIKQDLVPKSYYKSNLRLHRPESISFSKSGQLAAIGNFGNSFIYLYEVDSKTFVENELPDPVQCFKAKGPHGITFFYDKYLCIASIENPIRTALYRISKKSTGQGYSFTLVSQMDDPFPPLCPKSIVWSEDGHFIIISYGKKNSNKPDIFFPGVVVSYRFHEQDGTIDPTPISKISSSSLECIALCRRSSCVIGSDLLNSQIVAFTFNAETGELGEEQVVLQGPQSQLFFPHGIAFSSDERYLSVGNFGDDKVTVYEVNSTSAE